MAVELRLPVVAHHRLICDATRRAEVAMKTAFVEFEFAEPVAESCTSAGGKCVSCSLSARLHDRAEMSRLDSVVASIPGFKMCH